MDFDRYGVDPRAPLFFLSYAQARAPHSSQAPPHELNRNVLRLFDDLSVHVSELVGRLAGADPGFMDRSISGGERWTPELLRAAGTCQVFVPLISAPLLHSDWCAKEWDAFSRRKIVRRDNGSPDHETGIVPVTWVPTGLAALPSVLGGIQRFSPRGIPDPDVAAQYQQEGVYGLLTMGLEAAYRAVVWRLAQRIAEVHASHWVEPAVQPHTDGLRNVFQEEAQQ